MLSCLPFLSFFLELVGQWNIFGGLKRETIQCSQNKELNEGSVLSFKLKFNGFKFKLVLNCTGICLQGFELNGGWLKLMLSHLGFEFNGSSVEIRLIW